MWSRARSWVRAMLRRSRIESEMDAELRFHIEAFAEDLVRRGVSRHVGRSEQFEDLAMFGPPGHDQLVVDLGQLGPRHLGGHREGRDEVDRHPGERPALAAECHLRLQRFAVRRLRRRRVRGSHARRPERLLRFLAVPGCGQLDGVLQPQSGHPPEGRRERARPSKSSER